LHRRQLANDVIGWGGSLPEMADAVEKGFGSILVSLDVALMIAARRW